MSEDETERTPEPEQLEHQLELVVASRVGEDQIAWTIFGIFWAAQVLLVGVLLQGPSFPPHPLAGIIVCLFGVAMSVAWALTQSRSLQHLERFETLTKDLEKLLARLVASCAHTSSPWPVDSPARAPET
jgi:hypothetical protein